MQVTKMNIPDVLLFTLDRYDDTRGFFLERWNIDKFREYGFTETFVQDNHSRSHHRVLRGIHYQNDPPQGKLVGVTHGAIYDVAVDLRPNSPTFGKYVGQELSSNNAQMLWIPPGFGHGFCVLGDTSADVTYKVSGVYNAKGEGGIAYNDPDLNIQWPIKNPVISDRDKAMESFADYRKRVGA